MLTVSACARPVPPLGDDPPCQPDSPACEDAREARVVARSGGRAERQGNELRIRAQNGRVVRFRDREREPREQNRLAGSLHGGVWVIHTTRPERDGYHLVHPASGAHTLVHGWPVAEPTTSFDGRRLAVAFPERSGEHPHAATIEVWLVTKQGFVREFAWRGDPERLGAWQPERAQWNDGRLRIVLMGRGDAVNAGPRQTTYLWRFQNGQGGYSWEEEDPSDATLAP